MNDWKKDLKSRFEDYQMGEPDGLWDSIEKDLPEKGRRAIPFWLIAGLAIAAAAALAIFVVPKGNNFEPVPEPIAMVEDAPSFTPVPSPTVVPTINDQKDYIPRSIPAPSKAVINNDIPEEEYDDFIPTEVPPQQTQQRTESKTSTAEQVENKAINILSNTDKKKNMSLSYKISTSASGSFSSTSSGYGSSILFTKSDISTSSISKINKLLTTNRETEKTVNHKMPVRISFDLMYNLTERIGIGTGISRTSLYSNFHSGTPTVYTDSEQKMVLIGIPLSIFYDIPLFSGRVGLYASAGGMWEKAVDYSLNSIDYIGGRENSSHSYSGSMPDYSQLSVNAVVGGHLRLSRNSSWSVFAEAGASWHFDNGSNISTIYNDKPLMPLVNFGLRYSINN